MIFVYLFFLEVAILYVAQGSIPDCSELVTITAVDKGSKFLIKVHNKYPTEIVFDEPLSEIYSNDIFSKITTMEWKILPLNNSDFNVSKNASLEFFVNKTSGRPRPKILRLSSNGSTLCESAEAIFSHAPCGIQGELDLSPAKILIKRASWSTGRNYRLKIPSYPNFIGYIVDLFFTHPITNIQAWKEGVKVVQNNSTHWSLLREWTDNACIKLVDVHFMVTFKEESDVKALLFNGVPLIGTGKSKAFFRNMDLADALKMECDQYLFKRGNPWFGEEKARPLWLEATVKRRPQIGVVVDFIFDEDIKELRLWELTAKKISDNHWRAMNPGLVIPDNGTIRFPLAIYYTNHYFTKLIGLKINGEVKCGLGLPTNTIISDEFPAGAEMEQIRHRNKDLETLYIKLLVCSILVAISTLTTTAVFGSILAIKAYRRRRKHLCDYPAPTFKEPEGVENNYASISEATDTTGTYSTTSQM